jgi:deazaflavin-dependent oxidoreductase (nitroreductase family)
MSPFQERVGKVAVQYVTAVGIVAYRLSGGRVAGQVPGGAPICLLTTTGRRTGRRRCVPLLCLPDGDELVVVASRGGMSGNPAWYLNLLDDPSVEVELGRDRRKMLARPATSEERERLWPRLVGVYEHFASYEARTTRTIPVVILSPVAPASAAS